MKIHKICQRISLLLLVILLVGCMRSAERTVTPSLMTPTLLITTELETGTVTPISTNSATGTSTVTSISTHSPTGASTPSYTLQIVPTLSLEDARKKLLNLLANNGGCHLPCLWGIIPGKSSSQEARNVLIPLSSISTPEETYFEPSPLDGVLLGTITPLYIEGELQLNTWVAYLYDTDGIVRYIGFRVREEKVTTDSNGNWISKQPIFDNPNFYKRVVYYSLSHVLSELGMPDSVMILASPLSGYPVVAGGIEIALLYPNQGIWVNYTTTMYTQSGVRRGCPANAHIEMDIYPSGNPDSFFSLLDSPDWGVDKKGYKPLNEATSMSVEQFYETFRNSTDKCIETPDNIWPTMEPGGDWPRP